MSRRIIIRNAWNANKARRHKRIRKMRRTAYVVKRNEQRMVNKYREWTASHCIWHMFSTVFCSSSRSPTGLTFPAERRAVLPRIGISKATAVPRLMSRIAAGV